MNRKELIEWLEKLQCDAVTKMKRRKQEGDSHSMNYQLGKMVAFGAIIVKLEEQEESEVAEL